MAITDSLGTWAEHGTVEPLLDQWISFPLPTIQGKTFRLIFSSSDWSKKANTWLWIRHIFYTGDRTLAKRVYPRPSPVIIDLPIPESFVDSGIIVTSIEVRKGGRLKVGITPHTPWLLTLHEKLL